MIEQVKAGKTNKEIVDYMVERYGDFVLYKPPFKANTVILWLGPVALSSSWASARSTSTSAAKSAVAKTVRPLTAEEKGPRGQAALGRQGGNRLTTFIIICVVFCLIADGRRGAAAWFGGRKVADAEPPRNDSRHPASAGRGP